MIRAFAASGTLVVGNNNNNISATASVASGQSFTLGGVTYYSSATDPIRGSAALTLNKFAPTLGIGFGQLSAERLEMKLSPKLGPDDAEALARGTRTIVSQVAALKSMVDDFRDYARLPAPVIAALFFANGFS